MNKKVVVTHISLIKNKQKNAQEITTTLTNGKLSMKNYIKFEKNNIEILSLEETHVSIQLKNIFIKKLMMIKKI